MYLDTSESMNEYRLDFSEIEEFLSLSDFDTQENVRSTAEGGAELCLEKACLFKGKIHKSLRQYHRSWNLNLNLCSFQERF